MGRQAQEAGLTPEQFARLKEVSDPEHLASVITLMAEHAQTGPGHPSAWDLLARNVDEYPHDLAEWIHALHLFKLWLEQQERPCDLEKMLGYLVCCTATQAQGITRPLDDVVAEMLETHGYTG